MLQRRAQVQCMHPIWCWKVEPTKRPAPLPFNPGSLQRYTSPPLAPWGNTTLQIPPLHTLAREHLLKCRKLGTCTSSPRMRKTGLTSWHPRDLPEKSAFAPLRLSVAVRCTPPPAAALQPEPTPPRGGALQMPPPNPASARRRDVSTERRHQWCRKRH